MYVRFVVDRIDRDSGKRSGIFHAAHDLLRSGALADHEGARLTAALQWFDEHLAKPTRLSRSRRPHRRAQAICWFRSGAAEHLAWVREMQRILEAHGVVVEMLKSRRPGYVVYEDQYQVAAYPFGETPT